MRPAVPLLFALVGCASIDALDEQATSITSQPTERCFDGVDDDHDGRVDEGCNAFDRPVQATSGAHAAQLFLNVGKTVAVDGAGVVHEVWLDVSQVIDPSSPAGVRGSVMYRRSPDNGVTWTAPLALTADADLTGHPKIAAFGSDVYVAYHGHFDGNGLDVYVSRSADHGTTWQPRTRLTTTAGGAMPSITAFGTGAAVVWATPEATTHRSEIYLRASNDRGVTWGPLRAVSSNDGFSSWTPAVTMWGPRITVAWTDERDDLVDCATLPTPGSSCREELYARTSQDLGATWGAEQRLTTDPAGSPQSTWAPSIQAWNGTVHVAYFDRRNGTSFEVFTRRSLDGGVTWQPAQQLSGDSATDVVANARPVVAVLGNTVQIVFWTQRNNGTSDIAYVGSRDNGVCYSAPILLTRGMSALHPSIALSPNGWSFLAWYASQGGGVSQLYVTRRDPATPPGC